HTVPIHQIAEYQVQPEAVDAVTAAITAFVRYVAAHEPGTTMYAAWQRTDDPTRFSHLFFFEHEAAHQAHGRSDAVAQFESIYRPVLVGGPVVFTDFTVVAANR
ncbi:MAG TPA: antibiotic biosynthesis monooxygenase family protein, partial [Acidimicrobiales bacterium]